MLHVLLGDLYAETGRPELARPEFATAARTGSKMQEMAAAPLAGLAQGTAPPAAEIARLRGGLARDCVLCHGS